MEEALPLVAPVTIRKHGQVTLPAEIRREAGVEEGKTFYVVRWPGEARLLLADERLFAGLSQLSREDLKFAPLDGP